MVLSPDLNKRLFGNCKVEWRIENSLLQMCSKKWMIQSPEFTIKGFEDTSWCMSLSHKFTNKSDCVWYNLKRSAIDSGPKYVWLNLKISCILTEENFVCFDEKLSLKKGSTYEACFRSMQYLQTYMNQSEDYLTILCHMIVYSNEENREFGECRDEGLKLLSKNMLDLYRSAQNFDIKLVFDDNIILAHRAILCARNEYFWCLIDDDDLEDDEFQEYNRLDFTDMLDYKGMVKTLAYLYTGDIRHVLEEPSFAIEYCASYLEISEIEDCYKPDNLILRSSIYFEEYAYILRGYEFKRARLDWNIHVEGSMRTYQLIFYPEKDGEYYIPLFIKTYERFMITCLNLDFIDENGDLCNANLVTGEGKSNDIDEKISEIIRKIQCNRRIFEVIIKLKLTTGKKISKIDDYSSVFVTLKNKDVHYETLSEDLEYLLDGGPFTDTAINNNGTYFWVHKCVLASRSELFSNVIKTKEEGEVIFIPNFDPQTISLVLTYLYSGLLLDASDDAVIEVYKAAVLSDLSQLKSLCSDWLKRSSKSDGGIRCRVVRVAEVYGDVSLKKSILSLLFDKKELFLMPNNPVSFPDVHTCRYCLQPL